jgi:heme/copper-type cytochrome/quinol oxidase subunit 2
LLKSLDYPIPTISTYSLPLPKEQTLKIDVAHLLEASNRVILSTDLAIQTLASPADVLHAFTISSLGIKVDAVPGRSNLWSVSIKRPGVYIGQCSEICGVSHAFIPPSLKQFHINLDLLIKRSYLIIKL